MRSPIARYRLVATACACSLVGLSALAMDVTVEAGVDRTITSDEVNALIASGEDLVKKGGGRFIIDQSLAGYKGEIRVEEGFLRCAASYALGDDDKGTIVSDGATLEFGRDYDGGTSRMCRSSATAWTVLGRFTISGRNTMSTAQCSARSR